MSGFVLLAFWTAYVLIGAAAGRAAILIFIQYNEDEWPGQSMDGVDWVFGILFAMLASACWPLFVPYALFRHFITEPARREYEERERAKRDPVR